METEIHVLVDSEEGESYQSLGWRIIAKKIVYRLAVTRHQPLAITGTVRPGCLASHDSIPQSYRLAVGIRNHDLSEHPQTGGGNRCDEEYWDNQTEERNSCSLEGRKFLLTLEHGQQDEHSDHQRHRGDVEKDLRNEVRIVGQDNVGGRVILCDVLDSIAEIDDDVEHGGAAENQEQGRQEAVADVTVEESRETGRVSPSLHVQGNAPAERIGGAPKVAALLPVFTPRPPPFDPATNKTVAAAAFAQPSTHSSHQGNRHDHEHDVR